MMEGIDLIGKEREEQKNKHQRSVAMDVKNNSNRELSYAASSLVNPDLADDWSSEAIAKIFPKAWDEEIVYKMMNRSYKERVIIAGAMLAAELDRINAIEIGFTNPVLTPENIEEWKSEFNTKMKLWYDLDKYIPDMIGEDWQTDLYEGSTVDDAIKNEKSEWNN